MGVLSGSPLLYVAAGLLLALALRAVFRTPVIRRNGEPLRFPPNTLPLVGNGILFLQARQKLFAWFVRSQHRFGYETYQVAVPTLPPGVVVSDPRNLDFVLKSEGTLVNKGDFVKGMMWDLFGHGIVNADGDIWRVQRKAGQSFLNTANIRVLTDVALPRYLSDTLAFLRESANALESGPEGDTPVDLQSVFHELTSRLMGKMAYNMEMHADDEFTVAFDEASAATTERFQNPLWFVTGMLTGSAAHLRRSLAIVKDFGRRIVASAVADRQDGHVPGTGSRALRLSTDEESTDAKLDEVSGSLIQSLLDAIPNQEMVADAALNYLSAGRDTVAQGLTWTFYMLMKHPRVVAAIRQEVARVLDRAPSAAPNSRIDDNGYLDFSALTPAALPYTMAVFYEGLRLFPPIPFEIKQIESATGLTLPDGTYLPHGALLLWCSWALNRSHLTWGEDAEEFRPERWLVAADSDAKTGAAAGPAVRLVSRSASEFPVFHGGPRACLGKKMAEFMAVMTMAAVVWHFDIEPVDDSSTERVTKTSLTLPMEGGLPCRVSERSVTV